MDILEGDLLVVGGKEYPIRECGEWATDRMDTAGFRRMAKVDAITKRSPAITDGKRGAPVAKLLGLKCTPLDPVSSDIRERLALDTPHELLQTFITDGQGFVHLVVEDFKK
jgi:hypothetical protein